MNHFEAKGEIKCALKAGTLVNGLRFFIHFTFQNAEIKYVLRRSPIKKLLAEQANVGFVNRRQGLGFSSPPARDCLCVPGRGPSRHRQRGGELPAEPGLDGPLARQRKEVAGQFWGALWGGLGALHGAVLGHLCPWCCGAVPMSSGTAEAGWKMLFVESTRQA